MAGYRLAAVATVVAVLAAAASIVLVTGLGRATQSFASLLSAVFLYGGSVALASAGTLARRYRPALVLRSCAAGAFLVLTLVSAFPTNVLYLAAVGLMTAAAVQATGGSVRRGMVPAVLSLPCVAGFVALVRWSLWWPHPDMRQLHAIFWAGVLAVIGVVAFVRALVALSNRDRGIFLLFFAAFVLLGAVAGFAILESMTASYR